ncbi:hypothetical protein KEF29_24890 [Streptomyces tuirus]|uniref:Uncharacterized protein n=1 Tax=Streptomyces tuirus TaxID=68278 RepID=A0A941FH74_9ACTN|nr:hypothetical protein [Streptomyces tuirus]
MSDQTPSQAEGDRDDEQDTTPRPTPSQAEGERDDDTEDSGTTDAGSNS